MDRSDVGNCHLHLYVIYISLEAWSCDGSWDMDFETILTIGECLQNVDAHRNVDVDLWWFDISGAHSCQSGRLRTIFRCKHPLKLFWSGTRWGPTHTARVGVESIVSDSGFGGIRPSLNRFCSVLVWALTQRVMWTSSCEKRWNYWFKSSQMLDYQTNTNILFRRSFDVENPL